MPAAVKEDKEATIVELGRWKVGILKGAATRCSAQCATALGVQGRDVHGVFRCRYSFWFAFFLNALLEVFENPQASHDVLVMVMVSLPRISPWQ